MPPTTKNAAAPAPAPTPPAAAPESGVKAAEGPAENKALTAPATNTEVKLTKAQEKRRQELAQSGYRLPAEQFARAEEVERREAMIAANMPGTDGSAPHQP